MQFLCWLTEWNGSTCSSSKTVIHAGSIAECPWNIIGSKTCEIVYTMFIITVNRKCLWFYKLSCLRSVYTLHVIYIVWEYMPGKSDPGDTDYLCSVTVMNILWQRGEMPCARGHTVAVQRQAVPRWKAVPLFWGWRWGCCGWGMLCNEKMHERWCASQNQLFFCLFVSGDNGAIIFLFLVRHYSVHEIMVVPNYKPSCKCSTTHSYQCIQCFCVCKQWFGCQCLGFFMCKQMLMHACDCTLGLYEHRMRVCSFKKLTGRKIPCCTREPNWCWYCTWLFGLTVYQLSYPAPILFFGLE